MILHNENVKQVFLRALHSKYDNFGFSTHIILQCIQDLKTEAYV